MAHNFILYNNLPLLGKFTLVFHYHKYTKNTIIEYSMHSEPPVPSFRAIYILQQIQWNLFKLKWLSSWIQWLYTMDCMALSNRTPIQTKNVDNNAYINLSQRYEKSSKSFDFPKYRFFS